MAAVCLRHFLSENGLFVVVQVIVNQQLCVCEHRFIQFLHYKQNSIARRHFLFNWQLKPFFFFFFGVIKVYFAFTCRNLVTSTPQLHLLCHIIVSYVVHTKFISTVDKLFEIDFVHFFFTAIVMTKRIHLSS